MNRQTSGDVTATVHSFLAQAEDVGEVVCGLALAVVARFAGLALALLACGTLFAITSFIQRLGTARTARAP